MKKQKNNLSLGFKKILASKKLTVGFLATLLILIIVLVANIIFFANRIYPGIYISNIYVSGLTQDEATLKVNQTVLKRTYKVLTFTHSSPNLKKYEIDLSKTGINLNTSDAVSQAFYLGHKKFFIPPKKFNLKIHFDDSIDSAIDTIAKDIDQQPLNATIRVTDNEAIMVTPSQDGFILDRDELKNTLSDYVNNSPSLDFTLPIKRVSPKLSYESAIEIKKRLDKIKDSPITLKFKNQTFTLDLSTVLSLIDFENSKQSLAQWQFMGHEVNLVSFSLKNEDFTDSRLSLNQQKLGVYFKNLSTQIDRPVEEPLFSFDGTKVTQFQPPQEGYKLNIDTASVYLEEALLNEDQKIINLPVDIIKPKNKLVNDLGIKELLGRGISNFSGSIPNRVYNVALTASRLNGILIPPGETFSFNGTVGDVSAETGYKQAYVIKSGRTVLDDGGGVCQDSTTLFRAVLYAGLPVVERTAHAYRVGYYEQGFPPGLDATVFSPSVDFKFKNDTPSHILIQAYTGGNTLYVDLYGTSDGRVSNISTPVVTNRTPPPPDIRQDDPTLPKGEVKQVDFAASGANVVFTRRVLRDGQTIISESFHSNYRPWQAIYLVGTKE